MKVEKVVIRGGLYFGEWRKGNILRSAEVVEGGQALVRITKSTIMTGETSLVVSGLEAAFQSRGLEFDPCPENQNPT